MAWNRYSEPLGNCLEKDHVKISAVVQKRQSRHASITVESSRVRKLNALYEMIHE